MANVKSTGKKDVDDYTNALVKNNGRDLADNISTGDAIGLQSFSPQDVAALTAKYDVIPTVVTMVNGQGFEGKLIGKGPPVSTSPKLDPKTGQMRESQKIETWVIELPTGLRFRIMETYEIAAAYPQYIGQNITTIRLAEVRVGGNMVVKYLIGAAKNAG